MRLGERARVQILEDHPLMRDVLASACNAAGLDVVHVSGDVDAFLGSLTDEPSVALIDLCLDGPRHPKYGGGLEILRELSRARQAVRSVVVTAVLERSALDECVRSGAWGFLQKVDATPDAVVDAVRAVASGERRLPMPRSDEAGPDRRMPEGSTAPISPREQEVLAHVSAGMDNLKIAAHLGITERTVRAHLASLYRKLQLENRTQLALAARGLGIRPANGV